MSYNEIVSLMRDYQDKIETKRGRKAWIDFQKRIIEIAQESGYRNRDDDFYVEFIMHFRFLLSDKARRLLIDWVVECLTK